MTSNSKKEARSKNIFEKPRKRAPGSNVSTNFCYLGRPNGLTLFLVAWFYFHFKPYDPKLRTVQWLGMNDNGYFLSTVEYCLF